MVHLLNPLNPKKIAPIVTVRIEERLIDDHRQIEKHEGNQPSISHRHKRILMFSMGLYPRRA